MSVYSTSIEQMYPPVPASLLVSKEWQDQFHKYFVESGELEADPFKIVTHTTRHHNMCVSVCLFKQSPENRIPNEYPVDEGKWEAKYWKGLMERVAEMKDFPGWKLRIYVEKNLGERVHAQFAKHPQVEVYQMAVNTVGACPGMLWRFMALGDRSLELVLETDIDESLTVKRDYMLSFAMDHRAGLGRLGSFVSEKHFLIDPRCSVAKNYATMIGSRVMSRPEHFDFDLTAAMRGFMAYRRSRAASSRPWSYTDSEAFSVYNQPIGGHIYGWGSHWYTYGFDERFLKHVLYYDFAQKGTLHTWSSSQPPSQMNQEGVCDLQFVRAKGNTTVPPHTAVRFLPMQLSPQALEIAFAIEEYRWIFEVLLQLIKQPNNNGVCGNLFFHDIAEPFLLQMVPKQLNLFQASRRASKVLELGFNAGHSAAIMLLSNPKLTIRAFDTCGLTYTQPCCDFLNSIFGNRITLIKGLSQEALPADKEQGYDLAHIDADHCYEAVVADLANSLVKCAPGAVVVMDDYEGNNDVARATLQRKDLLATDKYTLHQVFPGSSHAIFHYTPGKDETAAYPSFF